MGEINFQVYKELRQHGSLLVEVLLTRPEVLGSNHTSNVSKKCLGRVHVLALDFSSILKCKVVQH